MTGPSIVWFRDDLRLADHPALNAAVDRGEQVIALYVLDEESPGIRPLGGAARWWLHHSLTSLGERLRERGGALVLGADLIKEPSVLHAAYNDAQGVTAAFNLNLLARANRELGASFDLAQFAHSAFYNAPLQRIEMHLVSRRRQRIGLSGESFEKWLERTSA